MKIGLLWFDDDPHKTLEEKVLRASARHEQKYGRPPNTCFVHPSALDNNKQIRKTGDVEIRIGRSVLLNHYWLRITHKQEIRK